MNAQFVFFRDERNEPAAGNGMDGFDGRRRLDPRFDDVVGQKGNGGS